MNNKALLQEANTYVAAGDYETFLNYCTDDTKWNFIGDITLQGKEAVREYMKQTYMEPPIFSADILIAEGDFVTAIGQISLKDQRGKTTSYDYCDVWRFENGKLAELKAFVVGIKSA